MRAHAQALKSTNEAVMMLLDKHQKSQELIFFRRNVARFIRYHHPNPAGDLQAMLHKVMELNEGGKCAGAYLSHFYSDFIKELDPFGDITFGLTENRAPEDTLLLQPVLPDETRNAAPTRLQDVVMIVTLPKFQSGPQLDGALRTLEQGFVQQTYRVVLFDLRYSGGVDLKNIAQIRASAARGWGSQPIVFLANRETRGVAAMLTYQFSSHPNVLVLGTEGETYGYGRKLTQLSAVLAPGLSPLTLTIGSDYIQPAGGDSNSDGYRMALDKDHVILREKDKEVFDKVMDRTEQWAMQAPPGDLGQNAVQTDPNAANANADVAGVATNSQAPDPSSADPSQQAQQNALQVGNGNPIADPGQSQATPPAQDPQAQQSAPVVAPAVTPPAVDPSSAARAAAMPGTF